MDSADLLNLIAQALFDKKGANILALDLRPLDLANDYCIIVEGNVDRHVMTLARHVEETLHKNGIDPIQREGLKEGEWAILDYGFVMVHIMVQEMRERYALEELFEKALIVDLNIKVS